MSDPPKERVAGLAPPPDDRVYLAYIASALISALAGGFLLAVWMPLAATDTVGPAYRVPWMIQAHGWIQLQGWAGLFVAGMGIRLLPRFAGRRPVQPGTTVPLLIILIIPVVLRLAIQPWAEDGLAKWGAIAIGVLSAAGQLGVAAVLLYNLIKGRKVREAWRWFALAGAAWWVVWAALSLLFIPHSGIPGYLDPADNDALLWVTMLGPVGNFIWSVQSRSVPVFFARKSPTLRAAVLPGIAFNAGAAAIVIATAGVGSRTAWEGAGFLLAGVGLAILPPMCGAVRGEPTRLRPRARSAARFVLVANSAAVLAGLLLCVAGVLMLSGHNGTVAIDARDAARHAFGIGLITMLILGMARLVAPIFALERTESGVPEALEHSPFWLLTAALVLRVGSALIAGPLGYENRMHTASLAGLLGWLAIAVFAFSVARAMRAAPRTKRALEEAAVHARNQRSDSSQGPGA
ncbi:MAG TPA: hypothetical protein PKK39_06200 [Tepidiformaceae bacterium]|nr:hypothetical protein [Tepidiformaceae bacterium]